MEPSHVVVCLYVLLNKVLIQNAEGVWDEKDIRRRLPCSLSLSLFLPSSAPKAFVVQWTEEKV